MQRCSSHFLRPARIPLFSGLALCLACAGLVAKPPEGKGKGKSDGFVPPGRSAEFVPPGHRRAPVEFVVKSAPPARRVEVILARPSPKHVWVLGYWMWEADAYVWLPGVWMLPPEPAALWVEPRFVTRTGVSIFISGYWKL